MGALSGPVGATLPPTDAPANVLSRFDGLRGAGGTFFMLDQLQPDIKALWGAEEPQGSVVTWGFPNPHPPNNVPGAYYLGFRIRGPGVCISGGGVELFMYFVWRVFLGGLCV